jgi:peptidoglycan hydrolase-like protein with peptidoglycan-binding domain
MAENGVIAFPKIAELPPIAPGEERPEFRHVQEFLQRFGYLVPGAHPTGKVDEPSTEGLSKFQVFNGLEPSGEFDEATREAMTTPRCAMADMSSGVAFATTCKWAKTTLTFTFDTGTNDVPGNGEFDAVRAAFNTWSSASPLTFTEVANTANPDIRIGWRPAADPDHSMVGGVLAHADFPPGCSVVTNSLPKPVHFDDEEHTWAVGAQADAFDVETVALHELGHILGLAHSSIPGAVMAPRVAANFTLRTLTADDIAAIQSLYGAAPTPPAPTPPAPTPPAPPPSPVAYPGRLLKFPPIMQGADVLAWQKRMSERGFVLGVDGLYGPESKKRCTEFQQQQGIGADGIVGPITWERTFAAT